MSDKFNEGATILVVDDNESARVLLENILQQTGYTVVTANDGEDAVNKLKTVSPHLILSDVAMPRMNGLELLKVIRQGPETRAIPVILLTALNRDENIIAGLDLGADDYLGKPFEIAMLQARIRSKLKRPPVPVTDLVRDYRTRLMTFPAFKDELDREIVRIKQ